MKSDRIQSDEPQAPTGEPPNWATVTQELHCPLCEYNLRGLIEPRCPECGHRFDWAALQDATRRIHPWLFEHHPERNIRDWIKTFRIGRKPRQFWAQVQSTHDVRVGRLLFYQTLSLTLTAAFQAMATVSILICLEMALPPFQRWSGYSVAWWGPEIGIQIAIALGLQILWPWFTILALMVFRISMRKRSVKTAHVVRCAVYSADAFAWGSAVFLPVFVAGLALPLIAGQDSAILAGYVEDFLSWFWLLIWGLFFYRLYSAYKKYLGFDLPLATVFAAQLVVAMTLLTATGVCGDWKEYRDLMMHVFR